MKFSSQKHGGGRGLLLVSRGFPCIFELHAIERIVGASAQTPFVTFGDNICVEAMDAEGRPLTGAIDQDVCCHEPATLGRMEPVAQ